MSKLLEGSQWLWNVRTLQGPPPPHEEIPDPGPWGQHAKTPWSLRRELWQFQTRQDQDTSDIACQISDGRYPSGGRRVVSQRFPKLAAVTVPRSRLLSFSPILRCRWDPEGHGIRMLETFVIVQPGPVWGWGVGAFGMHTSPQEQIVATKHALRRGAPFWLYTRADNKSTMKRPHSPAGRARPTQMPGWPPPFQVGSGPPLPLPPPPHLVF